MRYLPLSDKDRAEMMESIGIKDIHQLYEDVPKDEQDANFKLPKGLTEQEIFQYFSKISNKNTSSDDVAFFMGAGCYNHYIPATVDHLIQRAEFLTAYTPYQPEISQGTLAVIFEFQSLLCSLTGMEVANASLYDGATAVVEAVLMAKRLKKKKNKVILANSLNPDYKSVLETYLEGQNLSEDIAAADNETACIIVQTPDFHGTPHSLDKYREICDEIGALLIVVNSELVSLGLISAPDSADIVVGDAASLGVSMNYGGPHLGYMTCKKAYIRQMPGRICGKTKDAAGKDGFVLTLNAREQHIRRHKATSNICSNQGLNVVAFTIHLALLGKNGLEKLAKLNHFKAKKLYNGLAQKSNIKLINKSFFNEFVIETDISADEFLQQMLKKNIMAGVKISENRILVTVTETNSNQDIKNYIEAI